MGVTVMLGAARVLGRVTLLKVTPPPRTPENIPLAPPTFLCRGWIVLGPLHSIFQGWSSGQPQSLSRQDFNPGSRSTVDLPTAILWYQPSFSRKRSEVTQLNKFISTGYFPDAESKMRPDRRNNLTTAAHDDEQQSYQRNPIVTEQIFSCVLQLGESSGGIWIWCRGGGEQPLTAFCQNCEKKRKQFCTCEAKLGW